MSKIILQTKDNITYQEWQDEIKRILDSGITLLSGNFPKSPLLPGKANIEVLFTKPLEFGLDAVFTYVQFYDIEIENPLVDPITLLPTGETETVIQPISKEIVSYRKTMPLDDLEIFLDSLNLPNEGIGFKKSKKKIENIMAQLVVDSLAFGGLAKNDWNILGDNSLNKTAKT